MGRHAESSLSRNRTGGFFPEAPFVMQERPPFTKRIAVRRSPQTKSSRGQGGDYIRLKRTFAGTVLLPCKKRIVDFSFKLHYCHPFHWNTTICYHIVDVNAIAESRNARLRNLNLSRITWLINSNISRIAWLRPSLHVKLRLLHRLLAPRLTRVAAVWRAAILAAHWDK